MPSVDYSSVKAWRISEFTGIDKLTLDTCTVAPPHRGQVTVAIHAVSLNYRDFIMVTGKYPGKTFKDSDGKLVPCSDGAGVVVDVGAGVTDFKVGDRVATTFHSNWEAGPMHAGVMTQALGGTAAGTLTQIGVYEAHGLVHIPDSLSFEEAATLPCAAVTAYTALRDTVYPVGPESTVLVQGTGGVSVFAAQLALAAGARVIATSSSDEKLKAYAKLGVRSGDLINYKSTPDVTAEVRRRVPGGVDHVVEVTGQLSSSCKCVKKGGVVTVIGFVGQAEPLTARDILGCSAYIRGILVGSRQSSENLLRAIENNGIKPLVDKTFAFEDAPNAFHYLESQKHVGKVVITVNSK